MLYRSIDHRTNSGKLRHQYNFKMIIFQLITTELHLLLDFTYTFPVNQSQSHVPGL